MKFTKSLRPSFPRGAVILSFAALAPFACRAFWYQTTMSQINTYYGVSVGPNGSNSVNSAGVAVGSGNFADMPSLAVGMNLSAPKYGITVGNGSVSTPVSTARHFSAGGTNSNPVFEVFGDRAQVRSGYQLILESNAGDVKSTVP